MKFHREGIPTLLLTILFGIIVISITHIFFPSFVVVKWFSYVLSGFLLIVILQFFRHPSRVHTINENAIIAPADGKVVVIEETEEPEFFKKIARRKKSKY